MKPRAKLWKDSLNKQRRTSEADIPEAVHFVFLGARFEFVHYLAILSAGTQLQPDVIYLHIVGEPAANYWWRLAEPLVTVEKAPEAFQPEELRKNGGIVLDLDVLVLKPFHHSQFDQHEEPFSAQDRSLFQVMSPEQIAELRRERLDNSFAVRLWQGDSQYLDLTNLDIALERNTLFASLVRELLEEAAPEVLRPTLKRTPQEESELLAAQLDALARETAPQGWDLVKPAYEACCRDAPEFALPFYRLACLERKRENFEAAFEYAHRAQELPTPKTHAPLPFPELYTWVAEDELAICAYWVGRKIESFERCTRLLTGAQLPDSEWDRVVNNRDFAVEQVKEKTKTYPQSVVSTVQWWAKTPSPAADVTLTITACRRPQLLTTTLNSFLQCCEDIHRIARWVCVDDGSSEQDLARFRKMYPFFELIAKERVDKGHAKSMNLLREQVATPYWLHLEDDWHFLARQPYIAMAEEILEEFGEIAQVLFNRNHAQTLACRRHRGGVVKRTSQGHRFHLHEYLRDDELRKFESTLPPGALHHVYWPHFSLCPSLMRAEDILKIGPFEPTASFFELEFAQRYVKAGFKSASFNVINALHIGRLTWETGENAYTLNDEVQFKTDS